ncbi:unnamed protein product [Trifolium pratense]|uniref:Uncharacterized protein n=1 Tax=Trifolium pratense TaxID=57577 RepID=A0ACB0KHP7_TRIPR|nr:unnamed protein product [Trifolium pratense]
MVRLFIKYHLCLWIVIVLFLVKELKGCLEKEKLALFDLKTFLTSNSEYEHLISAPLTSWDVNSEDDCCFWEGVKCNHTTGHVMDLLLEGVTSPRNISDVLLLNFSFFLPFNHLVHLDLSNNHFNGWVEIEGLCGMKNLQELDLSKNRMSGHFPHCLNNLTSLRVLDLSSNNFVGNIPSFITNLNSLEYLSLFDTNFDGLFSFSSLTNHSNLEVFLLSPKTNNLYVEIEESSSWHPTFNLKVLQLRNCFLNSRRNGTFPSFLLYQHELQLLDLSHNKLEGDFPSWILENNTKLETLYLMNNSFKGTLQLPTFKHGLLDLQISNNKIGGELQENIGEIFSNLFYVNLSKNSFEGNLPSSIGEMQKIRTLDLSNNNFSGEFNSHLNISNLTLLILLRLSHNSFHGHVVPILSHIPSLRWLYLNNNSFSGEIEDEVSNNSLYSLDISNNSLYSLDISNNMISGRFPRWIGSFTKLQTLSLSKNQLQGDIPNELCNLLSLYHLDLSENNLSGFLPSCFHNLTSMNFLYLQKNSLQGYIPHALSELTRLRSLDLRDNNFFGNIPQWINRLSGLRVLLLAGNKLTGPIPINVCKLKHVNIMDLSHNWINETIPSCFRKISFGMVVRKTTAIANNANQHVSNDSIQYYSSSTLSIFRYFEIWFYPGNTFHIYYNSSLSLNHPVVDSYMISYETVEVEFRTKSYYLSYKGNNLDLMSGLDLSSNNLSGSIPPEIGELRDIIALNLSHNRLSGTIPESFSKLINIESLDLCYNNLSGKIPQNLTDLYSLAIFNVSYNKLSGSIPTTMQFANFDENNYRGNSDLCGSLINISCNGTIISTPTPPYETSQNQTAVDMESFYWSFITTYVTVVIGLAVIIWVNSHWCRAWFHYVDLCIFYCFPRCLKKAFH